MKSFRERLKAVNESVTKVTLQSGETAIGANIKEADKVKTLLSQFDWYAEMIDDSTKHKKIMAQNREIMKQLKGSGVDVITNPGYVSMSGSKGREINLKMLKESEEAIANFAEKSGKSIMEVEGLWNKATKIAADEGHAENYAYITSVLKKMLSINENDESEEEPADAIDTIINTMVFSLQTHIYHLLTKGYAEHVAIGDFYTAINESADKLAEMYIGLGGEISRYDAYDVELGMVYDIESFKDELHEFRESITSAIDMTNDSALMSLNDTFIDIQKSVDGLLYKLTLS